MFIQIQNLKVLRKIVNYKKYNNVGEKAFAVLCKFIFICNKLTHPNHENFLAYGSGPEYCSRSRSINILRQSVSCVSYSILREASLQLEQDYTLFGEVLNLDFTLIEDMKTGSRLELIKILSIMESNSPISFTVGFLLILNNNTIDAK